MTVTIFPGVPLTGTLDAIPSKSAAHRLMICAALADGPTTITCPGGPRTSTPPSGVSPAWGPPSGLKGRGIW